MSSSGLPVHPVRLPSDLVSASNGRLGDEMLSSFYAPGRGTARGHRFAVRAWRAMAADAARHGWTLTITSLGDAYRPYESQVKVFLSRTEQVSAATWAATPRAKRRRWEGRYYRFLPGVAPVATPGTSNHGWGLAFDAAWLISDRIASIKSDQRAWTWLLGNAHRFGFSWEVQSEPWHVRYVTGDNIPSSVFEVESSYVSQFPPFRPENGEWSLWPLVPKPVVGVGATGDLVRYLQGVLRLKAGQRVVIDGHFGPQTEAALRNLQLFFFGEHYGPAVTDQRTWGVIDQIAGT